jgi:thiaminase
VFGEYVTTLRFHADEALAFTPELLPQARQVVEKVADLEVDFWGMAYNEQ